jgi:sugar/nucleoside kinase (ribokinase family)
MEWAHRLVDAPSPTMTMLPDGSIDRRYGVLDRDHAPKHRETFREQLAADRKSFVTEHRGVSPGGQAVNAAMQANYLGADVSLYGHLDHDVFDVLDVEAHSMGAPASVNVYQFMDSAMLLTTESTDIRAWTYDDLVAAGGEPALDADAVVWGNWASLPQATPALERVASRSGDGGVFVLDPGEVSMRAASDVRELLSTLGSLADRYEVAVSVNDEELRSLGDAVGVGGDLTANGMGVRDHSGVDHVVMHGTEHALAVTDTGVFDVPNFETADVARFTGGGDRFSAALGFALACGWDWQATLELCNACASYYVGTGVTADRDDVETYVTEATVSTRN